MQNLNVKDKARNAKTANSYLERVLNQLLTDYQTTSSEREQLAVWEETQEFTILGAIEMFATDIRGYAFQAIADARLEENIVDILHQLNIFDIPYFADWYFSIELQYPQIKRYVDKLNYLRLLVIEYIKNY